MPAYVFGSVTLRAVSEVPAEILAEQMPEEDGEDEEEEEEEERVEDDADSATTQTDSTSSVSVPLTGTVCKQQQINILIH